MTIAQLNDLFRSNLGVDPTFTAGGNIMVTPGIAALGDLVPAVLGAVARYDAWRPGDDPHAEHDFGALELPGIPEKIYWKMDYYAPGMEWGSEDPADPAKTVRVLTIMLASEY